MLCACGSLAGTRPGLGAAVIKNYPGAEVFVGIGQGRPRKSPVTGIVTHAILLLDGLASACILCPMPLDAFPLTVEFVVM